MTKAGFLSRIAALLLDLALFVPLYFAAVFALTRFYGRSGDRMWDLNPVEFSATVGSVLWLAYWSFEWIAGATPGKMLLKMKILLPDAAPAPRSQLFLRFLIKHSFRLFGLLDALAVSYTAKTVIARSGLSAFFHEPLNFKLARILGELAALAVAGGFLLALNPGRRALHDLLTGTQVYRRTVLSAVHAFQPVLPARPALPVETARSEGDG